MNKVEIDLDEYIEMKEEIKDLKKLKKDNAVFIQIRDPGFWSLREIFVTGTNKEVAEQVKEMLKVDEKARESLIKSKRQILEYRVILISVISISILAMFIRW